MPGGPSTIALAGDAVIVKPLLRGWSHVVAFVALAAIGGVLIAQANATDRGPALIVVYVVGTGAMFATSSAYHRVRWRPIVQARMSKLDHCMIFLAIAGAYTPITTVALNGWREALVLSLVWGGSLVGIVLEWAPTQLPRAVFAAVYVVVGWAALPIIDALYNGLGPLGFSLVIGGGVAYTSGAVVYALRRPDPWPTVFGFHEVFHLCTIVGAGLHCAAVGFVVVPAM